MPVARLLNAILLVLLVGGSVAVYAHLPQRIPTHFGLDGTPDAWADKSPLAWFALPAIAMAVLALLYVAAALVQRYPKLLNIPEKKRFLELSPAQQDPVFRLTRSLLEWVGLIVLAVFTLIQAAIFQTARGQNGTWLLVAIVFVSPITLILAGVYLGRVQQLIPRAA